MMNDNDIASKFKATIHILFVSGRIIVIVVIIRIQRIVKTLYLLQSYSIHWLKLNEHIKNLLMTLVTRGQNDLAKAAPNNPM